MESALIFALVITILLTVYYYSERLTILHHTRDSTFLVTEVQLKKQRDLILSVLEIVKKYTQQEKDVFESVTASCVRAANLQNINDKISAKTEIDQSLARLTSVGRKYSQLMADESYIRLQTELRNLERVIIAAVNLFNDATKEYNTAIDVVPTNIVAKLRGFKKEKLFESDEGPRPTVLSDYQKKPLPMELGISNIHSNKSSGH